MHPTTFSPANAAAPASESERSIVPHLQRSALFRDYVKAYETTTGLPLALRPTGTFQSPLHQSKQVNPFCALMAANSQSCAACLRLQQRIETEAVTDAQTLQCFAGLTESAIPVRLGEKVLGHLQTGQVMFRAPTASRFKTVLRHLAEFGMTVNVPQLEKAYFQTRIIPKKQYESAVRLVAVFAQHLATLSNQVMVREATAELPSVVKARAFIAEHVADEICLNDVAHAVNMSGFYFCKVFKKATGLTFTDYLARTRIEMVKTMLLNPHTRISEAAYAAGFQSLSQFNRVFRRIVGEAPTGFREHLDTSSVPTGAPGRSLPHAA